MARLEKMPSSSHSVLRVETKTNKPSGVGISSFLGIYVFATSLPLFSNSKSMPSTTGTTPATIADMIDGRGKGEGASKSAQHRTQSSGILDAYSIDPELPLLWQKKWARGNILDMKSSSINTKDHNKTAPRHQAKVGDMDTRHSMSIRHHSSSFTIIIISFFHSFMHSVSLCFFFFVLYVFLSFFRSFFFLSFIHSCHCTGLHVISLIHSFIYSFMHSFIHHDEL